MAKKLGTLKVKRLFLGTDSGKRGTEVTSSAAELNIMDGVTATATEVNLLDNMWASVALTATPASGSCETQFVFKDAAGTTMATPVAGQVYLSTLATGLNYYSADSSWAIATNGAMSVVNTNKLRTFTSTAAGLFGLTITAAADDYYTCFIHPTGKLVIAGPCTVNA